MTESEARPSGPRRKKHHRFLFLVIGVLLGVALSYYFPRYAGPYLEDIVSPDAALSGEVTDKVSESDRLVLKVSTEEGVLLASFQQKRNDVDILVDEGDSISLNADRYRPFLEEPTILSVEKPGRARAAPEPSGASDRQAYQEKLEAQLAAWEEEIAALEARAAELGEDVESEYREQLQLLRERRDAAREKLTELGRASGAAWEDVKAGADRAWGELRDALEEARSKLATPSDTESSDDEPPPSPERS